MRRRCSGLADERGFTLIELLVVVLIIGILAAIALPTFLNQADKARDSTAKSDVRNAVSEMESCFRSDEMYLACPDADHPLAAGVGVTVTGGGAGYIATKLSASGTSFAIERLPASYVFTCTRPGTAGCKTDGSW